MGIRYVDAGVDKEAGYRQVQMIKDMVSKTYDENVLSSLGGFAGLYRLDTAEMKQPVLVSGTDGVGTKLKLAFLADRHDTVGEDCVAMCVNDILCQGARPLFFLDYIATGKLEPAKAASIVSGIASGCQKGKLSLIGGETAEMPGFYAEGEYDLAGFAVGVVDAEKIIDGSKIAPGDRILGLKSSGVHSNGFSLVRKIVFDLCGFTVDTVVDELGTTLGEELLKPTRIYPRIVTPLFESLTPRGIVHITGGGLYENVPRIVPEGLSAVIDAGNIPVPTVFRLLQKWGSIEEEEMYATFNMGVGMVLIVAAEERDAVAEMLKRAGEEVLDLGVIEEGEERLRLIL